MEIITFMMFEPTHMYEEMLIYKITILDFTDIDEIVRNIQDPNMLITRELFDRCLHMAEYALRMRVSTQDMPVMSVYTYICYWFVTLDRLMREEDAKYNGMPFMRIIRHKMREDVIGSILHSLIDKGLNPAYNNLLYTICSRSFDDHVYRLINMGNENINGANFKFTCLTAAIVYAKYDIAIMLMDRGADTNMSIETNIMRQTIDTILLDHYCWNKITYDEFCNMLRILKQYNYNYDNSMLLRNYLPYTERFTEQQKQQICDIIQ